MFLGPDIHPIPIGENRGLRGKLNILVLEVSVRAGRAVVLGEIPLVHPTVEAIAPGPLRYAGDGVIWPAPHPSGRGGTLGSLPAVRRRRAEPHLSHTRIIIDQAFHPEILGDAVGDGITVVIDV